MKIKAVYKRICWVFAALLLSLLCIIESVHTKTAKADGTETVYSNVMDDLKRQGTFDESKYPDITDTTNEKVYSLQLIQIAESSNDELFLYVYQPSNSIKDLKATTVHLSVENRDEIVIPKSLYSLSLVSTNGVFDKYVVKGLEVIESDIRIYNIISLFRYFDSTIDKPADYGNVVSEVSCDVGKKWTALDSGGSVVYVEETIETIKITGKYAGYIRLENHPLYYDYNSGCDSFFVGFKTDRKIENLMSARVYAEVTKAVSKFNLYGFGITAGKGTTYSEIPDKYFEVSRGKDDGFVSHGFLGAEYEKYAWEQIQTVDEFYADTRITHKMPLSTAKDSMDWVLRFLNAPYTFEDKTFLGYGTQYYTEYIVNNVSVLELTFKENDEIHIVGVVDNKQSGSKEPAGKNKIDDDWIVELFAWLLLCLGVIAVCNIFPPVANLFTYLIKGIWWLVCLPFKLLGLGFKGIGKLFKRKDKH